MSFPAPPFISPLFPLLLLAIFLSMAKAPCPPIFFAQAISSRQIRTMDFYFTKSGVPSAAECANLCGQRHFCQSAVFNHNARSCALSPSRPVQCRMAKHRFNSFHLTTDGADAISLLACIQHCEGRTEKEQNGGGGSSHLLNIDLGGGRAGEEEFPSPQILPIHDEKAASILEGKNAGNEEGKGPSQFLGAIQRLYQMQRRLEQILAEAQRIREAKTGKEGEGGGNETLLGEGAGSLPPWVPVHSKAAPLLQMAEGGQEADIIPLAAANFSTAATSSQVLTRILQNGTQLRVHSAGFVAKLRPGEKIKLLSASNREAEKENAGEGKGEEGAKQFIQLGRTLAVQIPAQLVTMAPELFESPTASPFSPSEPTVVDGRLLSPPEGGGFLHSLLIHHGKMPKKAGEDGGALSLDSGSTFSSSSASNSPSTVICFRFVQHRRLQHEEGARIWMERGIGLNECRCACANTWRRPNAANASISPCKSLRFNAAEGICELLGADHNEKLDLVLDRANDYHYVSCEPKYLLKTADKMCKREEEGKAKGEEAPPKMASEGTTTAASSELTEGHSPKEGHSPSPTSPMGENSTEASEGDGCFERIQGHSLRGTAAGLERGVSISECECLCANSLRSRMYSFQCASASYFHADRDCILNLDSRHSAPDNFVAEKAADLHQEVTYLGMLCPPERAIASFGAAPSMLIAACTSPFPTQLSPFPISPTSSPIPSSSLAPLSDSCFLEQPGFVLEGLALAVETQISAIQCKCQCILAERRHGTACQSAQFYFDSRTCLLNRQNRASAPERFSFDEKGQNRHSYLDFRCSEGVDGKMLAEYLASNCAVEMAELAANKSTGATESTLETTTAKLKLLGKGKRKKGRKQPKEKDEGEGAAGGKNETVETTTKILASTTTAWEGGRNGTKGEEREEGMEEIKMETRTAIPAGDREGEEGEMDSKIPEMEGWGEEASKGWKTIRVQRGEGEGGNGTAEGEGGRGAEQQQADPIGQIREQEQKKGENATPTVQSTTNSSPAPSPPPTSSSSPPNNGTSPSTTLLPVKNATTAVSISLPSANSSTTPSTPEYPPVGQCRFSALYQTVFNGARLLKRLLVESPAQCLAACHWENCRSANLIQMEDKQKVCELFRDSIVEFRRTDVLSFDRLAVHFDSVQCKSRNAD